ncbi:MAG: hypothetical protein AAB367_00125 [Patescibacteria group bacterium]
MDFLSVVWIASLVLFIAGPTVAGIFYKKEKISASRALITGLIALVISAALSWLLIAFL